MAEIDWRTPSGKAGLAATCLVLLSLFAFLMGAFEIASAVAASTLATVFLSLIVGSLWVAGGLFGLVISDRIRKGELMSWLAGLIIGLVVLLNSWSVLGMIGGRGPVDFAGGLLATVGFLLALVMSVFLLLAVVERPGHLKVTG